jgi:hypothetical protein
MMSQDTYNELEDAGQHAEPGELVHWMEPGPLRVGLPGLSATAVGAFVLGLGVGAAALAVAHWMGRDR